jgi:hypothetical protein
VGSSVHACAPSSNTLIERSWRLGPDVLVHAKGILLRHAIDTVFYNLGIEDAATPAKTSLVFELRRIDKGRLRLFANGLPIVSLADELELAPALEGTLIGCAVRKRSDSAALHAATVELGGHGVLLAGSKGSGKSTLALSLVNEGARYFGDEIAFVRYEDATLDAFPKAVTLKEGSFSLFPEVTTYNDPVRGRIRYHRPLSAVQAGHRARIDLIVFPCWSPEQENASIDEVPAAEVALELIRASFGGLERDRRMLSLVRRLAQVPAYRIEYGDALAASEAIQTLLAASRARVVSCESHASSGL